MKSLLKLLALSLLVVGCTAADEDDGTETQIFEYDIAYVTADVEDETATASLSPTSIPVGEDCSACDGTASSMRSWTYGALALMGIPDALTCMVEAMTETQVIAGLGDGETYYIEDTEDGANEVTRINVTVTGSEITAFTVDHCEDGSQESHIDYTLVDGVASFSIKSTNDSDDGFQLTATGDFSGGSWNSKSVEITQDGSSDDYHYVFTQYSDRVSVAITNDTLQFYGEAALSGENPTDYALGAGTAKVDIISGGANLHWDENGEDTSTESSYASSVTSASYASAPDVSGVAPSGDEVFSCSLPTGASYSEFSGTATSLSAFQSRWLACQEQVIDTD